MKLNINKIIITFLIIITIFSVLPLNALGEEIDMGTNDTGGDYDPSPGYPEVGGPGPKINTCSIGSVAQRCIIYYGHGYKPMLTSLSKKWHLQTFDIYDNDLQTPAIAGMYFGGNINEHRTAGWSCTAWDTYECEKYTIVDYIPVDCGTDEEGIPIPCTDPVWDWVKTGCKQDNVVDCNESELYASYKNAIEKINYAPSYTVEIDDPNDANCGTKGTCAIPTKLSTLEKSSSYPANPATYDIYYLMYGSCINAKTGHVRYLQNSNDKCNNEEYYIENADSNTHWHIFIPLNQKSDTTYNLYMIGSELSATECKAILTQNKENYKYINMIKPKSGSFTKNTNRDKQLVANGCYLSTTMTVKIIQKFYNEEKSNGNVTFDGFAFNYRPININNPFPNGIDNISNWKDLYNSTNNTIKTKDNTGNNKTIHIENSYDKMTYKSVMNNSSINAIRTYNDGTNSQNPDDLSLTDNPYTLWNNMNIDGTSNLIKNASYIEKYTQEKTFKLGCGPQNINATENGAKNPYYQCECKGAC